MSKQKKIIHFHPNGEFAKIFVQPLIDAERAAGHISNMVVSTKSIVVGAIQIPYDVGFKNLLLLPFAIVQIFDLFQRETPKIIITHNSKSSPLVLICAWCAKVPVRIYFNHGVPYKGYSGLTRLTLLLLEKINLRLSTKVISVSIDMVNLLRELCDTKSINIVHHGSASGIDPSFFSSERYSKSTFRLDHNIAENDFLVVFIGRPVKRKGFELVLNLWEKYFFDAKYKLVLCGPTEQNVVNTLGFLPNNVIALGFTAQVPNILAKADILILPSFHEGLPYAILESMASQCLVIANRISGVHNLVTHEFNGFLVDNNDIDKYAEIIKKIQSTSKSDLDLMRANGFETAKKYSREEFLHAYLLQLVLI
jgi:N,N'-diacetylbacillosaminyl-diphospho-undecaprenol alpha-1,3-N-acetylgalactosaminyltransferase